MIKYLYTSNHNQIFLWETNVLEKKKSYSIQFNLGYSYVQRRNVHAAIFQRVAKIPALQSLSHQRRISSSSSEVSPSKRNSRLSTKPISRKIAADNTMLQRYPWLETGVETGSILILFVVAPSISISGAGEVVCWSPPPSSVHCGGFPVSA